MSETLSEKPSAEGGDGDLDFHKAPYQPEKKAPPPSINEASPPTPKQWRTPWHDHVDSEGQLITIGNVRIALDRYRIQWVLYVMKGTKQRKWDPKSYHRETESLDRVLREFVAMKEYSHVTDDLRAIRKHLLELLGEPIAPNTP